MLIVAGYMSIHYIYGIIFFGPRSFQISKKKVVELPRTIIIILISRCPSQNCGPGGGGPHLAPTRLNWLQWPHQDAWTSFTLPCSPCSALTSSTRPTFTSLTHRQYWSGSNVLLQCTQHMALGKDVVLHMS